MIQPGCLEAFLCLQPEATLSNSITWKPHNLIAITNVLMIRVYIYIYCICMCMCICNCACIYGNYNIRMMSTYMVYKESWKECQVCVCVPIHSFRSKDRDEKSEQEFEKQDRTRTPVFSLGGLWGRSAAGARRRIPTTSMAVHGCSLTLGTSWNPRVADLKKGQCFEPAALAPWAFQPHSQNLMKT